MSFDRLLYTDCLPGQGRAATGGFQVQARSAGVDNAQEKAAVAWLLYETQLTWINADRPVGDFPLGFAHSSAEGIGTAQSLYLGKAAVGSRPGNYLADCLLTHDRSAYGVVRPAQLWRAPFWRDTPWTTTECPRLDEAVELGPLDAEELARWVRSDPQRPRALAGLLSVLESGDRRVILVAEDPDVALRWIAAATLLLPMDQALDVSFKVFTANASRAQHRVLAVPRSLNPQVRPGGSRSAHVLDADSAVGDEVTTTARADSWVALLGEADPFDVVDAVELAAQLCGTGLETPAVRAVAWLLVADLNGADVADPASVVSFLETADPQVLTRFGTDIARRLVTAPLDAVQLRSLAALLGEQVDTELRRRLLSAELAEVRAGGNPQTTILAAAQGDRHSAADMESAVASAVLLSDDVEAARVLQVAHRHGIRPPVGPVVGRLEALVRSWVDDDRLTVDLEKSIWREQLVAMLHAEVRRRFAGVSPEDAVPVLHRFAPVLAQERPLVDDPFEIEVFAAGLRDLSPRAVGDRIHAVLTDVRSAPDAARLATVLQAALLRWRGLDGELACWFVRALPAEVPPALDLAALAADALRRIRRPGVDDLETLHVLVKHYDLKDEKLDQWVDADRRLGARLRQLGDAGRQEIPAFVDKLVAMDRGVLGARMATVVATAVGSRSTELGAALLDRLPDQLANEMVAEWSSDFRVRPTRRALTRGIEWAARRTVSEDLRRSLLESVAQFLDALPEGDRTALVDDITTRLSPEASRLWEHVHTPTQSRVDRLRSRLHRG